MLPTGPESLGQTDQNVILAANWMFRSVVPHRAHAGFGSSWARGRRSIDYVAAALKRPNRTMAGTLVGLHDRPVYPALSREAASQHGCHRSFSVVAEERSLSPGPT